MFQKDMKISFLLDFYGDILSERRRSIIEMYYNEDLSLSEIADETGISRQGVRDSVKKSETELLELEKKLGLAKRFENLKSEVKQIADMLEGASAADLQECEKAAASAAQRLRELDF